MRAGTGKHHGLGTFQELQPLGLAAHGNVEPVAIAALARHPQRPQCLDATCVPANGFRWPGAIGKRCQPVLAQHVGKSPEPSPQARHRVGNIRRLFPKDRDCRRSLEETQAVLPTGLDGGHQIVARAGMARPPVEPAARRHLLALGDRKQVGEVAAAAFDGFQRDVAAIRVVEPDTRLDHTRMRQPKTEKDRRGRIGRNVHPPPVLARAAPDGRLDRIVQAERHRRLATCAAARLRRLRRSDIACMFEGPRKAVLVPKPERGRAFAGRWRLEDLDRIRRGHPVRDRAEVDLDISHPARLGETYLALAGSRSRQRADVLEAGRRTLRTGADTGRFGLVVCRFTRPDDALDPGKPPARDGQHPAQPAGFVCIRPEFIGAERQEQKPCGIAVLLAFALAGSHAATIDGIGKIGRRHTRRMRAGRGDRHEFADEGATLRRADAVAVDDAQISGHARPVEDDVLAFADRLQPTLGGRLEDRPVKRCLDAIVAQAADRFPFPPQRYRSAREFHRPLAGQPDGGLGITRTAAVATADRCHAIEQGFKLPVRPVDRSAAKEEGIGVGFQRLGFPFRDRHDPAAQVETGDIQPATQFGWRGKEHMRANGRRVARNGDLPMRHDRRSRTFRFGGNFQHGVLKRGQLTGRDQGYRPFASLARFKLDDRRQAFNPPQPPRWRGMQRQVLGLLGQVHDADAHLGALAVGGEGGKPVGHPNNIDRHRRVLGHQRAGQRHAVEIAMRLFGGCQRDQIVARLETVLDDQSFAIDPGGVAHRLTVARQRDIDVAGLRPFDLDAKMPLARHIETVGIAWFALGDEAAARFAMAQAVGIFAGIVRLALEIVRQDAEIAHQQLVVAFAFRYPDTVLAGQQIQALRTHIGAVAGGRERRQRAPFRVEHRHLGASGQLYAPILVRLGHVEQIEIDVVLLQRTGDRAARDRRGERGNVVGLDLRPLLDAGARRHRHHVAARCRALVGTNDLDTELAFAELLAFQLGAAGNGPAARDALGLRSIQKADDEQVEGGFGVVGLDHDIDRRTVERPQTNLVRVRSRTEHATKGTFGGNRSSLQPAALALVDVRHQVAHDTRHHGPARAGAVG